MLLTYAQMLRPSVSASGSSRAGLDTVTLMADGRDPRLRWNFNKTCSGLGELLFIHPDCSIQIHANICCTKFISQLDDAII